MPTPSSSRITPSSPSTARVSFATDEAEHRRTDDAARRRSRRRPPGTLIRSAISAAIFAATRTMRMSRRTSVTSIARGVSAVGLERLEEVPAGSDRADFEPEGRDPATQAQHVHVERVPSGAPARPRSAHEGVTADDRVEAVDQRGRERPLDRRERDPPTPVPEQAVVVDRRGDRGAARHGRPGSTPGPGGRPRRPGAGSSPRADRPVRARPGPLPRGGDGAPRRPAAAPVARFPRAIAPARRRSSAHRTEGSLRIGYAAVNAGLLAPPYRTSGNI